MGFGSAYEASPSQSSRELEEKLRIATNTLHEVTRSFYLKYLVEWTRNEGDYQAVFFPGTWEKHGTTVRAPAASAPMLGAFQPVM